MTLNEQSARILLVEDNLSLAQLYMRYVNEETHQIRHAETGQQGIDALENWRPHVVMLDLMLPDMSGLDVLRYIEEHEIPTTVMIISARDSVSTAVDAMRLGAYDFMVKPFNAERLIYGLRNALEQQRLTRLLERYEESARDQFADFIGASEPIRTVYRLIEQAAPSQATVFITGESGTGKELCAAAIHKCSQRAEGPFVAINCAALPKDLIESEIFGHVRGAFTSADSNRIGAAQRASGGTLFLDEICEMDIDLQAKLLRFIQTGMVQPVGSNAPIEVDVRFVCASNKEPRAAMAAGLLREDLYYRLNVIPITMPALRQRGDDILALARHFLTHFAQEEGKKFQDFAADAAGQLLQYPWPGNVRELQNVIRRIVVLNNGGCVSAAMVATQLSRIASDIVSDKIVENPSLASDSVLLPLPEVGAASALSPSVIQPLWLTEKIAIERALDACQGNIARAAALLQINASTIYRKKQIWADRAEQQEAS